MDEATVAAQLRQNLPQQDEITPAPPTPQPSAAVDEGTNAQPTDYRLDEMTLYKIHEYFGEHYRDTDEISKQQAEYIYKYAAKLVDNPEYGYVLAKVREIERLIGATHSERRMFRVYQWIKLDSMRKNIESAMGALTNG